jgi:hypothetical protein
VATLDRRKFAAPVFAQAAAFIVVLLIGGLTGSHGKPSGQTTTPPPSASSQASTSPTPSARVSPTPSSAGSSTSKSQSKLTVEVTNEAAQPVTSVRVKVIAVVTQHTVTDEKLTPSSLQAPQFQGAWNVAAGGYEVCLAVPSGTSVPGASTAVLAGWFCAPVTVAPGGTPVTFRLVSDSSQAHG